MKKEGVSGDVSMGMIWAEISVKQSTSYQLCQKNFPPSDHSS